MQTPYGFRIVGQTWERRRRVDAGVALRAYAACDPNAQTDSEAYLSAFQFGPDFIDHMKANNDSTKGFAGPCWAPFIWWDIDREGNADAALAAARKLVATILARYRTLDADDLLIFFSGSKGYHVGLPVTWDPPPSTEFNAIARQFALGLALQACMTIDEGIYDKVRAFRAPNSWHPKTGLHKRRLTHDELMHLDNARIRKLAAAPAPFTIPTPAHCPDAAADWIAATSLEKERREGIAYRVRYDDEPRLNKSTLDYIKNGANKGDRHRLLFSAAANLGEFGCPPELAHALLTEAALDDGLTPSDVERQIKCGLAHGQRKPSA